MCGIRDLRKTGSLWGMRRGVGGARKSIRQSWLAKGIFLPFNSISTRLYKPSYFELYTYLFSIQFKKNLSAFVFLFFFFLLLCFCSFLADIPGICMSFRDSIECHLTISENPPWPQFFFLNNSDISGSGHGYHIYQPLRSGRIWDKVNFLSGV